MQQKSDKKPAASTTTPAPRGGSLRLKTRIKAGVNNENIPTWE